MVKNQCFEDYDNFMQDWKDVYKSTHIKRSRSMGSNHPSSSNIQRAQGPSPYMFKWWVPTQIKVTLGFSFSHQPITHPTFEIIIKPPSPIDQSIGRFWSMVQFSCRGLIDVIFFYFASNFRNHDFPILG